MAISASEYPWAKGEQFVSVFPYSARMQCRHYLLTMLYLVMSTYCWSQADSSIQLLWIIRSVCWFLCIKSCHKCKSKCSLLTADTEYTFPTKGGYVLTILFGYMIITVSLFAYHGSCALFPHRRVFRLIPNYRGIFWHEQSISNKVRAYCVQAGIVQHVHAYCVQDGIVQHSHRLPIVVVLTEMQRGLSANSLVWQRALTTLSLLYDIFLGTGRSDCYL